jgi:hypothetical protein
MSSLHESNIGKGQRMIGYFLSVLVSLGVLVSGVLKFTPNAWAVEPLEKLGLAEHAVPVGVVELLVVLLYWIPKTSNIGFFLFCVYVGGILMAEIMMGEVPVPALSIGVMVLLGTLLRKPSLVGWEA